MSVTPSRVEVDPEIWSKVQQHPLFRGIGHDELSNIRHLFKLVRLRPGEFLFQETMDSATDLYVVHQGNLDVIRSADTVSPEQPWETRGQFTIARLAEGDVIGELGFIRGGPRTATIRSNSRSVLLCLGAYDLQQFESSFPAISNHFMKNMLEYMGERLKQTSDNEVRALRDELTNSIQNSRANLFFSYVIGILCVYNLAVNKIASLSIDANRASMVSALIIALFTAALVLMIRQSKLPIRIFGLTLRNWRFAVRESLLYSAAIIGTLVAIKALLIATVPRLAHLPLFDFDPSQKYLAFNFILYGLHSPIQEFIARGVLQGCLQHFFTGNHIKLRAIIISNALFSATHVHLMSGLLGLIVFVPGLFWGWLYTRHQNLIGVSISHILIGWSALFFLRVETLF